MLALLVLAACTQQGGYGPGGRIEIGADGWRRPTHYYPPPGPRSAPWGPYIREAAGRYSVPERWVRAVMQQESGGEQQATSPVGAMGLMQVMPATYEELRVRHRLGDDPYEPHNNVLAGTAYIREMYDRFGAPGFLAAYNAGPDRVESYLAGRAVLPDETVNYLAAITPNLGNDVAPSGRFAVASARSGRARRSLPTVASLAAGCDLNAAYNPNRPCTSLERAALQPAATQPGFVQQAAAAGCDLNAAYDPNHPCTSAGMAVASSAPSRQAAVQPVTGTGCDVNAAYDPYHPCTSQPVAPGVQLASAAGCDPKSAVNSDRSCRTAGGLRVPPARARQLAAEPVYQPPTPSPRQRPSRSAEVDWRMGDSGRRLQEPGSGSRGRGGCSHPGARTASVRRTRPPAYGAVRQFGPLSRPSRPSVSQRGGERLHASEPSPTSLRCRPAEPLLIAQPR